MATRYRVSFELLAGPADDLALNGGHFITTDTEENAEAIAARLRTSEGAAAEISKLVRYEATDYARFKDQDLRLGEVTISELRT